MDIEDDDFNELLAEKRHKELSGALKKIAMLLSEPIKSDNTLVEAIKNNMNILNGLISVMNQQKEVSVTVDNNALLPLLKEIKEGNDRILTALNDKPIVDEFKVQNTDRYTKTIEVIYKKSSQATLKK